MKQHVVKPQEQGDGCQCLVTKPASWLAPLHVCVQAALCPPEKGQKRRKLPQGYETCAGDKIFWAFAEAFFGFPLL